MKEGNHMGRDVKILPQIKYMDYDVIESIIEVINAKDTYTAQHSKRVGGMAGLLCDYLGENDQIKEMVHIASCIHDIGKIGIPNEILNKPGKLTEEEWQCMKSHTAIGAEMLEKVEELKPLSKVVLYHHERWDGKGYYGIKGEAIPLEARIIAICDSIDAMTSSRAYRKPLTLACCKSEIESNIGKMYDPRMARVAVNYFEDLIAIKDSYLAI